MQCESARPQLEAYLDNELARSDARELESHVDGCADCRAALDRLDALRRALREPSLRHAAPVALRERIAAAANESRATTRRPAPAWLRIAAALMVAFGAGGASVYLWRSGADSRAELTHDAFASHWRALAAVSPVDVVSSDRHTVKPWFAGKVAQAPTVRDFADRGFPLVGGRVDYLGAQRVPVLVYRHGQHIIDVFVLPPGSDAGRGAGAQQAGYTLRFIALDGQTAAIVSDTDASELADFAHLLGGVPTG